MILCILAIINAALMLTHPVTDGNTTNWRVVRSRLYHAGCGSVIVLAMINMPASQYIGYAAPGWLTTTGLNGWAEPWEAISLAIAITLAPASAMLCTTAVIRRMPMDGTTPSMNQTARAAAPHLATIVCITAAWMLAISQYPATVAALTPTIIAGALLIEAEVARECVRRLMNSDSGGTKARVPEPKPNTKGLPSPALLPDRQNALR